MTSAVSWQHNKAISSFNCAKIGRTRTPVYVICNMSKSSARKSLSNGIKGLKQLSQSTPYLIYFISDVTTCVSSHPTQALQIPAVVHPFGTVPHHLQSPPNSPPPIHPKTPSLPKPSQAVYYPDSNGHQILP